MTFSQDGFGCSFTHLDNNLPWPFAEKFTTFYIVLPFSFYLHGNLEKEARFIKGPGS